MLATAAFVFLDVCWIIDVKNNIDILTLTLTPLCGQINAFSDQINYELQHKALAILMVGFALNVTNFLNYYTPRDFGRLDTTQKKLFDACPEYIDPHQQGYALEFLQKRGVQRMDPPMKERYFLPPLLWQPSTQHSTNYNGFQLYK